MILFKPEHVGPILAGRKTQTRRLGEKRWNAGAVHQCKTSMYAEPFARVRIISVRRERLGDISEEDVRREGYGENPDDYRNAWESIYHRPWEARLTVWVIDFELVEEKLTR